MKNEKKNAWKAIVVIVTVLSVLAVAMAGTASAKSLYVIADINAYQNIPIHAYDIQPAPTYLVYQTSQGIPDRDGGAVGLTIDTDSGYLFATFEFSDKMDLIDGTTMKTVGQVTAPQANDLAGIVVDQDKQKVYTVDRDTNHLYVYKWDAVSKTLTLEGTTYISLKDCSRAYGIALDEVNDLLYVGDKTMSVKYYRTDTWTKAGEFAVSHYATGIAIDVTNQYVYTGSGSPGSSSYLLSKYDLSTGTESTVNVGSTVLGVAVDPASSLVYITTYGDGTSTTQDRLIVYDSSLNRKWMSTDIGNPTGLCVPGKEVSYNPLSLSKDDGLAGACVNPGDTINYEICYDNTLNTYAAYNVTITDTLSANTSFVSASGGGTYDSGTHTVTWDIGTLTAGAAKKCEALVLTVKSGTAPGTTITNSAVIDSDETPPTTKNVYTTVCAAALPDLVIKDIRVLGTATTTTAELELAGDKPSDGEKSANAPVIGAIPSVATTGTNATYKTDEDNANNAGAHIPDYDMDVYLFRSSPKAPIEFYIENNVSLTSITSAKLTLYSWDVDDYRRLGSQGERDMVYFNGHYVGDLTGADDKWSTSTFTIKPAWIKMGNENLVKITIDELTQYNWAVEIDWGMLIVNEGTVGNATITSLTTDKKIYTPGETITATTEVDTTLSSQSVKLENNLIAPDGTILTGDSTTYTTSGTTKDPKTISLMLPGTAKGGIYTVEAIVYDAGTMTRQDSESVTITVPGVAGCYVEYLIENIGNGSAPASTTYLYVDGGSAIAADSTATLAPGASRWDSFAGYSFNGTHLFRVCADGPNSISETIETNNCKEENLTCTGGGGPPGGAPTVNITPASQTVSAGKQFTIDVAVAPAGNGISCGSVTISFNAGVMQVNSVVAGNLLGASPMVAPGYPKIDNTAGTVETDLSRVGATVPPTSNGTWATITLTVKSSAPDGTYGINITSASLANETFVDIPGITTVDGTVTVEPSGFPRWDINEDGVVDYKDLGILGAHYGETTTTPYPRWDINEDGVVDYKDLGILGAHYGETTI